MRSGVKRDEAGEAQRESLLKVKGEGKCRKVSSNGTLHVSLHTCLFMRQAQISFTVLLFC